MSIRVDWEGPYSPEIVMRDYCLNSDIRRDFGLYQIYGPHDLYSNKKRPHEKKVLLYIGKTTDGSTFAGRIGAQGFCHNAESDFEVFLGRVAARATVDQWKRDVDDAEKLLIVRYAPPYNGQGVGDLRADQLHSSTAVVHNHGEKADLDEYVRAEDVTYALVSPKGANKRLQTDRAAQLSLLQRGG